MADRYTILGERPRGILSREERDRGMAVIADLQIDRAFRTICPDSMYRESFLSVLATPLTDPDEIRERQRIARYFHENPQTLDRVIEVIRRLLLSKNQWDAERSRLMASRRVDPQDKNLVLWVARENLVLTAHFARIILLSIRDIYETMNMFGAEGGWLGRLKDAAWQIASTTDTETILSFCDKVEKGLAYAHTYDIEFDCSEDLRVTVPFLADFAYVPLAKKPDKPQRGGLFSLFGSKKNAETEPKEPIPTELPEAHVSLSGVDLAWGMDLSARAVQECDRILTSLLRTAVDRFSGLEEELYFYRCLLIYQKRFEELGVKMVYPDILPESDNVIRMGNLSDLLLLAESLHVSSVIPNDVNCVREGELSGMLVTGRNNSGKTVYLRSIGTAVLLAQCGCPVTAEFAEISVRRRIFTAFARAEGELVPLSSAGRFEEEVAEIAAIVGDMEPDSLLLLNETFQTTAYDEGAEGMAPILAYLSALGCGFIFVTHLTRLIEMLRGTPGVTVMRTSDDPRTRYKIAPLA
ncbi:MAG: hypothetical protein K6G29_01035 [Clostridiales bacterium]|nr:hypothetical protein [Clostridiales bacterium]